MGSTSIQKHEVESLQYRVKIFQQTLSYFETVELWNQGTKKLRDQRPRNQETFLFSTRGLPLPLNVPTPTPAPAPLLENTRELGGHEGTCKTVTRLLFLD